MKNTESAIEANEIQSKWMALDSNGPKSQIDKVIKEYEQIPTSYIVQSD